MVSTSKAHEEIELRRRMLVLALGLKPRHLRDHLGLDPPLVSFILTGARGMTPKERARFMRLIRPRVEALFC